MASREDKMSLSSTVTADRHVCLYRQLRMNSKNMRIRNTTTVVHASFGCGKHVINQLMTQREKFMYVGVYQLQLPLIFNEMNNKDRCSIIKLLLEIAVEIYKKRFPPETFEFNFKMQYKVHVGGEIQAAVDYLAEVILSKTFIPRMQTLKVAIKNSQEVSVLPLVYLYTMGDCSTGIWNSFPKSCFRIKDAKNPKKTDGGYVKYGEREIGASLVGGEIRLTADKSAMMSCDLFSINDPRFLTIQGSNQDSYDTPTLYQSSMEAFQRQEHHQQHVQSKQPKWLKAYCIDMLTDIYRSVPYDMVQGTSHRSASALNVLQAPEIKNALPRGSPTVGDDSPMMSFLCGIQNCVDTMESIASEVVSAHILSQDLIPLPYSFYRYTLPSLYNSSTIDEGKKSIVNCKNGDAEAFPVCYDVSSLLSYQTKKKARLASLLYKSEEVSKRLENLPLNTRNMKEFEEQKSLQCKIEEKNEVNMDFLEKLTNIFGAHESGGSNTQYVDEVEGLGGVRLETMEPADQPLGISTGFSPDCGGETGGLPPNDLQNYIHEICNLKAKKNDKRLLVRNMLSPDALTTVAVMVEELATEMVLSWKQRILDDESRIQEKERLSPPTAHTNNPNDEDPIITQQKGTESGSSTGEGGLNVYTAPLRFSEDVFIREVDLQLQGADFDGDVATVQTAVQNRMEVLFGKEVVHTSAIISLIESRVSAECKRQQDEESTHTRFYQEECQSSKEAPPRKRFKF